MANGPTGADSESRHFCELEAVSKSYGGAKALDSVDFSCNRHSIHAVLGENGAGKSTLIKIIVGVVQADSGRMLLEGDEVSFASPIDARRRGIVPIFQELSLLPDLTVADNICITDPPGKAGFIDKRAQRRRAEELLARVGCEDVNPLERPKDLPLSRRQLVELAKALSRDPKMLILDETTSALTASDVERVFVILGELRDRGLAILYISHRMAEIEAVADTCSVFRNGMHVDTFRQGSKTPDEIVHMMVGREIAQVYPKKPVLPGPPRTLLELRNLSWQDRLHDISLTVGEGEIVGLGGLDGQGQREVLLALFGVLRGLDGDVSLGGRKIQLTSPADAKSAAKGIAMIPEDRKSEGLMLPMSVRDNLTIASLGRLTRFWMVDRSQENARVEEMVELLKIRVDSVDDPVASLSGGNQQKVVIAKWLVTGARVLLLMDPTRGIDVGTKQEIYRLMRQLADEGAAILFYTTDYDELVGMCDRVLILYRGRMIQEFKGEQITEYNIVATSLNLAGMIDRAQEALSHE